MSQTGLRQRKKQKTREAIQREAMRLFEERGYSATTVEQIAAAAEISSSTFFNYFPTKEDVVLYDAYDPQMISIMSEGPAGEALSDAIRRAMQGLAGVFERDRDMIWARAKLSVEVPALRARVWEELERTRDLLAALAAGRSGRDAADFELRLIAMVVVAAAFEAIQEWIRQGGRGDLLALVNQALDVVDAGARLDAITASADREGRPDPGRGWARSGAESR